MSGRTFASEADGASAACPGSVLHRVTFNYSGRIGATGWDKAAQAYVGALHRLTRAAEHAGQSLDGRVVSIYAKQWRDRGHEIVAARFADYGHDRAALLSAETADPENIAGKVRLLAEALGLPDPWRAWTDDLPPAGSREAEAFTPAAVALAHIYGDLRRCRREMDALRKQAKKAKGARK